ncbi:unnamed protein product [Rotaria sordida]|uniref:protein disulfide-isomerase n=1 Tax=Rotaria sordida TaxID=392033 RepID=A0A819AYN8_9BILA|nr:unnamed protein product [Rotaria sordida]
MFPGFMQGALLAVVIILTQTTKCIHCDDTSSNVDESHVLSLAKDTFDDAVKNNKHLLVKFVASWCDHCKELSPAYAAAAKQLVDSGSDIKLASIDATIEHDLAQKYDVKVYPTIKFFSDGTTFDYTGGRARDDIISWLKKKTGPAADELKTVGDLRKLKEANEVVFIGAFKDTDGDAAASFLQVAKTIDGIPFGITSNKDVLKELDIIQDTIVLFKKFDESRNDLTATIDDGSIREFIQANQLPIVVHFNAELRENGKDKNGSEVDGLYIPVKKAYEMWSKGGEFMKSENGNYTPIPSGAAKAEGTGENAKIKVLVNKLKEGNAVVSCRVNDQVYWTWHVWVTDDPTVNENPADKDRVIEIPLRKAYAMYKLHLSVTEEYPQGNIKSGSIVWTTNTGLIQNMEFIDGTKEKAKLRITLNENQYGFGIEGTHEKNYFL